MSSSTVINLRTARRVDPGHWLTGPIRVIQLVTLPPDGQLEIAAESAEHTLFILDGTGTVTSGDTTVVLRPDVAVTLPLGTRVTVVAGPDGLEYFQASLDVPADTGAAPRDVGRGGEQ